MQTQRDFASIAAMAFYHENGMVPAWNQAMRFAGDGGRIATMPDIVSAKLATDPERSVPWNTYFTTSTAEYMGLSRGGQKILIVAHGIGPMATLDGVLKAYSYEYSDRSRRRRGGRISREEFWKLEDGFYGNVGIVELSRIQRLYRYPFGETLTASQAVNDPLLRLRLGPRYREYIFKHMRMARRFHQSEQERDILNPSIIQMRDANNCSYLYHPLEDGVVFAHLVSVSRLMNMGQSGSWGSDLVCEIDLHEWWNGTRLCGVRKDATLEDIHPGVDADACIKKHWRSLMRPTTGLQATPSLSVLKRLGEDWFTQYPKVGERMDTHEVEYKVTSITPVGEQVTFRTTQGGGFFFKYGINEVGAIAPPSANAYSIEGDVRRAGEEHFEVGVQFYKVEVDRTQRVIKPEKLANDFDLLMQFA